MSELRQQSVGAPALADVLRVAANAWMRFRTGSSLDRALAQSVPDAAESGDVEASVRARRIAAAARDIAYTATRHLALLDAAVAALAPRAPAAPVAALLAVALGQLIVARRGDHVIVDQAVRAAKADAQTRAASGFVNALLRRWLRDAGALMPQLASRDTVRWNAPPWWIERLRTTYGDEAETIPVVQRAPPPLVVRVNRRRIDVAAYLAQLRAADIAATRVGRDAVWLHEPCAVEAILGFAEGLVSVQDAGVQLAAEWLEVEDGMRVLDACAAPGGKTAHIAELAAAEIDAIEIDAERAARIESNLARTGPRSHARIRVIVADATQPATFFDGPRYDRILLDAPCTASGIVRRHPDIPWLRRPADVAQLATQQARLLDALWPLLAPAGRLLYVVCSVFPEEGVQQVKRFAARWPDARAAPLAQGFGPALQLLPCASAADVFGTAESALPTVHDGFFFASFQKT